jgi:hypothetical protein
MGKGFTREFQVGTRITRIFTDYWDQKIPVRDFRVFRGSVFIHDSFLLTDKPASESGAQRTHSKTLPRNSCAPFLAKRYWVFSNSPFFSLSR